MSPPVPTFHVSSLPTKLNALPHGKTRSPPIDLATLPLKEMIQYRCDLAITDLSQRPAIVCKEVARLYRVCEDGKMIETTAWEKWRMGQGKDGGV
ncbi:hypothetical protein B0J11DRAFT_519852 [Dendryphion nanum]|uniref:Uncharacterized protein n=1 Tax=Dendryphion nanum TaxID=256645 RepID=A0A9P9IUM1_9PLEO|nr:hypothetical protein B0J11DRAFT_519852 [Dendryphion nanum]